MAVSSQSSYSDIFNTNSFDGTIDTDYATITNLAVDYLSAILPATTITSTTSITAPTFVGALQGNADTATTAETFSGSLEGDVSGPMSATSIGAGVVTNSMLAGSISNDKLLTL